MPISRPLLAKSSHKFLLQSKQSKDQSVKEAKNKLIYSRPLSKRFFWRQMTIWLHFSESSANSIRRTKLQNQWSTTCQETKLKCTFIKTPLPNSQYYNHLLIFHTKTSALVTGFIGININSRRAKIIFKNSDV